MKGEDLLEDDHIVRYVKPSMIQEDGFPDGAEFRLRPSRPDETGLSVNWLEAFDPGKQRQLAQVWRLYRLSMKHRGRFAELNVGAVRTAVTEEVETLRVVHDPLGAEGEFEEDPSHAEITGLSPGDTDQAMLVGDLIAECVLAMHPAICRLGG